MNTAVVVVLFVLAAAAGSAVRYLAASHLNGEFPVGTLVVNLVASLGLGVVVPLDDPAPIVLGIAAMGALSTWSTTAVEVAEMSRGGHGSLGAAYLGLTVSSGILVAWFGLKLGQFLF